MKRFTTIFILLSTPRILLSDILAQAQRVQLRFQTSVYGKNLTRLL